MYAVTTRYASSLSPPNGFEEDAQYGKTTRTAVNVNVSWYKEGRPNRGTRRICAHSSFLLVT